jgi:F420H(2)-dependent quinone reductase
VGFRSAARLCPIRGQVANLRSGEQTGPEPGASRSEIAVWLGELKRWLYRGNRPNAVARAMNQATAAVHAWGIAPNYMVTLEVVGRRSGRRVPFPLVMVVVDGQRYLVSMVGADVAWVHNLRAAGGRALLRHGRAEQVRLEEIPIEERDPVLKAYVKRAPGARPHLGVDKDVTLETLEAMAARVPVFRVVAAG